LKRAARYIAKRLVNWRYRSFNPQNHGARIVKVDGLKLGVARGVFDPSLHFTSGFMAKYISRPGVLHAEDAVLDVGTGTGVLAIAAGRAGCKKVVGVDLSPLAVACASGNVRRHGLADSIQVEVGGFVPYQTPGPFNVVITNPPYFRGSPTDDSQMAYLAGAQLEWFDAFIDNVTPRLRSGGRVLMVLSDTAEIGAILQRFKDARWTCRIVARQDILIEVMYIFQLTPPIVRGHRRRSLSTRPDYSDCET
jgi:methylase of polypeptide subunit release factors